ncbi:MAG: hypothetical protein LBV40_00705, partial [Methanomicrobiales archaeon]|nr:hypothetical protein [Methanomicrobiales archaeon]
ERDQTAVLSAARLSLASKIRPYYWAIQDENIQPCDIKYAPEQPFDGYATNGSIPQVLLLNFFAKNCSPGTARMRLP